MPWQSISTLDLPYTNDSLTNKFRQDEVQCKTIWGANNVNPVGLRRRVSEEQQDVAAWGILQDEYYYFRNQSRRVFFAVIKVLQEEV